LAEHFLAKARERIPQAAARVFTSEAMAVLLAHPWPGNVRELQHLVERLAVTSDKERVDAAAIKAMLEPPKPISNGLHGAFSSLPSLRDLEQQYIDHVLERTGGNKTKASEILGIDPSTLHRRSRTRG